MGGLGIFGLVAVLLVLVLLAFSFATLSFSLPFPKLALALARIFSFAFAKVGLVGEGVKDLSQVVRPLSCLPHRWPSHFDFRPPRF